jgi:hypothetical protein
MHGIVYTPKLDCLLCMRASHITCLCVLRHLACRNSHEFEAGNTVAHWSTRRGRILRVQSSTFCHSKRDAPGRLAGLSDAPERSRSFQTGVFQGRTYYCISRSHVDFRAGQERRSASQNCSCGNLVVELWRSRRLGTEGD